MIIISISYIVDMKNEDLSYGKGILNATRKKVQF